MININLLPKELKRRRRASPHKLAATALPLLVLLGAGWMQVGASQERARLETLERDLRTEQDVLQPFIAEQTELQSRRAGLAELQSVAQGVRQGQVIWSEQLFAMLETRPPAGDTPASRISFQNLEMRALDAATSAQLLSDNTYEGLSPVAEMDVSGLAGSAEVVADYVRELQRAPNFGVVLRDLAREEGGSFYTFSMTVGAAALSGGAPVLLEPDPAQEGAQGSVQEGADAAEGSAL